MRFKYIGPFQEVDVVGIGRVKRDEPVDVPGHIAGRAPQQLEDGAVDLGEGLLAQPDVWQPVKPKTRNEEA